MFLPLHPQFSKSAEPNNKKDAPVAQLVEHLTLNQGVQGSSPCGCTKQDYDMLKVVDSKGLPPLLYTKVGSVQTH